MEKTKRNGVEVLSDFNSAGVVHLPILENNRKISSRENELAGNPTEHNTQNIEF